MYLPNNKKRSYEEEQLAAQYAENPLASVEILSVLELDIDYIMNVQLLDWVEYQELAMNDFGAPQISKPPPG